MVRLSSFYSYCGHINSNTHLNYVLDNTEIPTDLKRGALALQRASEWDDEGGEHVTAHEDDEYRWAGVEDPKIVVTTSREPSSRLKMFAKVLKTKTLL